MNEMKAIVDGIVKNEIDASVNQLVQVCELLFTLSQVECIINPLHQSIMSAYST